MAAHAIRARDAIRDTLAMAAAVYEAQHGPVETTPPTKCRSHYRSIHDEYAAAWRAKEHSDERFMVAIRPMIEAGKGAAAIAAQCGVDTARIRYICGKHEIEVGE
jgi:hypothetical protein